MSGKDPFEFKDEEVDRTVIGKGPAKPAPIDDDFADRTMIGPALGSPAPAAAAASSETSGFRPRRFALEDLERVGPNPLVAGAAPLFAFITALRPTTHIDKIGLMRERVVEELRRFQQIARAKGASDEDVRHGHYALCALLDEVVLSTPWGAKSPWAKQSLVATFHNEVVSGDRLLEMAEALEARPGRSPNLLELVYMCLSFGFEGRLRLENQGASRLFQMRERLYNAIRQVRGPIDPSLSPQWRGVDAGYKPIAQDMPLWVFWAGLATLGVLVYAALLFSLSEAGDRALQPLAGVFSSAPASLNRSAPAPVRDSRLFTTIFDILKPDIDAGRVTVRDGEDFVTVRLMDKGLFASGSADLDSAYDETTLRLAQAVNLTTGDVAVAGFTDNKRIRSLRYASNQELSEARAADVSGKLAQRGVSRDRLKPSGQGESQPVADNTTEAGRRLNRRVEVAIPKTYAAGRQP